MPGLEPGNPEGADLQSAAVAAVPHPHSVFKHLWESSTPQAEMNNKRLLKTCQRKPRRRAYSCHKTYTRGGWGCCPCCSVSLRSTARCAGCDKVHTRGAGDVALPAQLRLRLSRSLRSRIAGRATSPASSALWIAEIMSWLQLNLACKGLLTETPPRDRGCV